MRLIDEMRADNRLYLPSCIPDQHHAAWDRLAELSIPVLRSPHTVLVDINNVAAYFFEESARKEGWDFMRDFPNLAPPWTQFWMEYRPPRDMEGPVAKRYGLLFSSISRERLLLADPKAAGQLPPDARWSYSLDVFAQYDYIYGPYGTILMNIGEGGGVTGDVNFQHLAWADSKSSDEALHELMGLFLPGFLAICFLHCKNVSTVDNQVDQPLAKKWAAKHGGLRPAKYKTLVIEPLKEILRATCKAEKTGLKHALRICRGHFSDYREGAGLFGKHHALVWYPMRVAKGGLKEPVDVKVKL